jgi:3-dehydroquinate synthase
VIEVHVSVGGVSYPVLVGPGVAKEASRFAPSTAERCALVIDPNVLALHGVRLRTLLPAHDVFATAAGEENKDPSNLAALWSGLAAADYHRGDWICAIGGGVTTDLAGFAAATYHRGIAVVHIPTTLLGQVDAAIGGKTAVDLPEGKNLVGAFHQPKAVLCDTDLLRTLPPEVFATGMSECIKHALIADPGLLDDARAVTVTTDDATLEAFIARSVAVKARIVTQDPHEKGERAFLNYGHTLAHALEIYHGFALSHGEAVAIGMMFASRLAVELGYTDLSAIHREALTAAGLPIGGAGAPYAEIREIWKRDKKYERGMRFIVLEDLGKPTLVRDIPEAALNSAYERIR